MWCGPAPRWCGWCWCCVPGAAMCGECRWSRHSPIEWWSGLARRRRSDDQLRHDLRLHGAVGVRELILVRVHPRVARRLELDLDHLVRHQRPGVAIDAAARRGVALVVPVLFDL